jgi:hypothetical protein
MKQSGIDADKELQQILWACFKYWISCPLPPEERIICHHWLMRPYKEKFGTGFDWPKLEELSELGFLVSDMASKSGQSRYYSLADPVKVKELLKKWKLR